MPQRLVVAVCVLMLISLAAGCRYENAALAPAPEPAGNVSKQPVDVHSYSSPQEIVVRHISLDLTADFEARQLHGSATLEVENRTGTDKLILDTRDLDIRRVTIGDAGVDAPFRLGEGRAGHGRPLEIDIRPDTKLVKVEYATSPSAAAVQWLAPEQTAGREHPFLFTQSQAILARSWVPCQDTPSVRMTYDATITVPRGLLALMSAKNPTETNETGIYTFDMPQAIPSYLLALAIGDIEFRPFDDRSGVYAERPVIEKAAKELEDIPAMMTAAEALYGPYRWGRYDVIILPPSFPFGGMENPRLTFATPTILAGDKSLVALIAHELAHSWSGNLVTNATWSDFWLNEGFTSYFELRIMEAVYGREYSEMLALLSYRAMVDEVNELGATSPETHLYLDASADRDPDETGTAVAYDKGYHFLRLIEETVGRETFDSFLKGWFDAHAFQSATTADFVEALNRELLAGHPEWSEAIDVGAWVYGPGIPENIRKAESHRFEAVDARLADFLAGKAATELSTSGWSTHEWLRFVGGFPEQMTIEKMAELDRAFGFSKSGNSEVFALWAVEAIKRDYRPAYPAIEDFLTRQGRRKFLVPIYRELVATEDGTAFARRVYAKSRPTYHPVSVSTIDGIVGDVP